MDNCSRELQQLSEASRDDFEFVFDDLTFDPLELQPDVQVLGHQQHYGPFSQSMVQGGMPVPAARGQHASPQLERLTSVASLPGSVVGLPVWSPTSSPGQDLQSSFDTYSHHPSPMLTATHTGHATLVGTSNSSLNEHLTAFSFGSASSEPVAFQLHQTPFAPEGMGDAQMGRHGVHTLFLGGDMATALYHSPLLHPQSSSYGSWEASLSITPNSSPSLVGRADSVMASLSPAQGSVQTNTPFVSPLMMPQSVTAESIPGLDLAMVNELSYGLGNSISPADDIVKRSDSPQDASIGFVHVESDGLRGGKALPVRKASVNRKTAGRRGPLESRVRQKAGKMRVLGACPNCRKRKASCDGGIYCRSCIRHYGVQILQSPCRGKVLSDLAEGLMRGGIFPTHRTVEDFLPAGYKTTSHALPAKLIFGFGPSIAVKIRIIIPNGDSKTRLTHNHLMYQWPLGEKQLTERRQYKHEVFPAILPDDGQLRTLLEQQLTVLVEDHFESFPRHQSKLEVLPSIHKFYKTIPESEVRRLLGNCLRLLVLVHMGGDFQMDEEDAATRSIRAHLVRSGILGGDGLGGPPDDFDTCPRNMGKFPVPCFIRGQFGKIMPQLANDLMVDILSQLEKFCLTQKCELWVPVLAAFTVIIMTVESIDYHAEKISFHASLDHGTSNIKTSPTSIAAAALSQSPVAITTTSTHEPSCTASHGDGPHTHSATPALSEQAFNFLLRFYHACFPSCHSQLTDACSGRRRANSAAAAAVQAAGQKEAQHTFIAELKNALSSAGGYLAEKGHDPRVTSDDLSFFFDRKVARFLLGLEFSH